MRRYHATPRGPVPFKPEEEVEWEAMIAKKRSEVAAKPVDRLTSLINALVQKGVIGEHELEEK